MSSNHARIDQARNIPWSTPSGPLGAKPVKSEPRSITSGIKNEPSVGFASYASTKNKPLPSLKTEPPASQSIPGSFRDVTVIDSDSDIEIIPASEYHDNGRHIRKPTTQNMGAPVYGTQQPKVARPKFSPEAQTAGNAALRRLSQSASNDALQMAMFGKQEPYDWMNSVGPVHSPTRNPFGSGLHSLSGPSRPAGGYACPSVYSNGMGGLNSMPGAYPGSMQSNGMGGMNTAPGVISNGFGGVNSMLGAYPGSMQRNMPSLGYVPNNGRYASPEFWGSQPGPPLTTDDSPQSSSSDELGELIRRAGNNYDDISDFLKLDKSMNNQLDYIMNDPRKTSQELKELLENIRPDVDLPPEDREGTPEGLVYPLVSVVFLAGEDTC